MSTSSLIIVDLQNDYFPGGKWPLVNIADVADNAGKLLANARAAGTFVIHVRHETPGPDAVFFLPGSAGAQIHESVAPQADEIVILKNHANSFRETELKSKLDQNGVDSVTICGAMSHMCIDATVRAAYDLGYSVSVISDACATRDLQFQDIKVPAAQVHASFMSALDGAYATVVGTEAFVAK